MFHRLDATLERFLRAEAPLAAEHVDLSFATPDKRWAAGVSRPTVNLFLWDLARTAGSAAFGIETYRKGDQVGRRTPLPRFDLRYLVTAWTSDVADEHALLGTVLVSLLRYPMVPDEHLDADLAPEARPSLRLAEGQGHRPELWSALDGQLKPGLDLIVGVTIDAFVPFDLGPPVTSAVVRVADPGERGRTEERQWIGGRRSDGVPDDGVSIRSPRGYATLDTEGGFVVPARPGDTVVVEDENGGEIATVIAPETGPVWFP